MASTVVAFCFLFVTVSAAGQVDQHTAWEKALIVLCVLPILASFYATIVIMKTASELKKIKELTASLLKSTEAMGISAAKASLGPSVKNTLLEYAKTVHELDALKRS